MPTPAGSASPRSAPCSDLGGLLAGRGRLEGVSRETSRPSPARLSNSEIPSRLPRRSGERGGFRRVGAFEPSSRVARRASGGRLRPPERTRLARRALLCCGEIALQYRRAARRTEKIGRPPDCQPGEGSPFPDRTLPLRNEGRPRGFEWGVAPRVQGLLLRPSAIPGFPAPLTEPPQLSTSQRSAISRRPSGGTHPSLSNRSGSGDRLTENGPDPSRDISVSGNEAG